MIPDPFDELEASIIDPPRIEEEARRSNGHDPEEPRESVAGLLVTPDGWTAARRPDLLVEGVLARGDFVQLVGAAKGGKTQLAHQLTCCIARGREFLGLSVQQARVLLLSLEMPVWAIRERMDGICRDALDDLEPPRPGDELNVVPPGVLMNLADTSEDAWAWRRLEELIRITDAEIVIFDSLHYFLSQQDAEIVTAVYTRMATLAKARSVACIMLDQTSRGNAAGVIEPPTSMAGYGSVFKGAITNTTLNLRRAGSTWKLRIAGHYIDGGETELILTRPKTPIQAGEERLGDGFVVTTEAQASGVTIAQLRPIFRDGPWKSEHTGRQGFKSKAQLLEALDAAGLIPSEKSNDDRRKGFVNSVLREFGVHSDAASKPESKPLWWRPSSDAGNAPVRIWWGGDVPEEE